MPASITEISTSLIERLNNAIVTNSSQLPGLILVAKEHHRSMQVAKSFGPAYLLLGRAIQQAEVARAKIAQAAARARAALPVMARPTMTKNRSRVASRWAASGPSAIPSVDWSLLPTGGTVLPPQTQALPTPEEEDIQAPSEDIQIVAEEMGTFAKIQQWAWPAEAPIYKRPLAIGAAVVVGVYIMKKVS